MVNPRPRVITNITENISLTAPAGALTVAIIGTGQWGELNRIYDLSSLNDAISVFGSDKAALNLIKGIDLLTRNNGSSIKAIRIGNSASKSTKAFDGNSGAEVGVLTFSALYEGTYGDNISIEITDISSNVGLTITDGVVTEVFDDNGSGYSTNNAIKAAIEENSVLISSVAVKAGSETINLVDATVGKVFLESGADGASGLVTSDYTSVIDNELLLEDFEILVTPRYDSEFASLAAQDTYFNDMKAKLESRAQTEEKYSVIFGGVQVDETIDEMKTRTSSGSRLAIIAPSIKYTPSYSTTVENLNGTFTACAYAGIVSGLGIGPRATHNIINVSPIIDAASDKLYYSKSEQTTILNNRIVPITREADSIQVIKSITRNSDTTSIYIQQNIVLSIDFVVSNTEKLLSGFLKENNTQTVRNSMEAQVDALLQTYVDDGNIEAFEDTVVTEGASPDTVNVALTFKPIFGIDFINLNISVARIN